MGSGEVGRDAMGWGGGGMEWAEMGVEWRRGGVRGGINSPFGNP